MGSAHSSAGVYVRELDLSQRIRAASSSIGAVVGGSSKGPVMQRTLITSKQQFKAVFGKPDPAVSQMHYAALAFLEESQQLYVTRVIDPTTALTAGAYLTVDDVNASTPILRLTNFDAGQQSNVPLGKIDPFNTLGFDPNQAGVENILGFFCAINPGAWNNTIHIRVRPNTKLGVALPDDPTTMVVEVFINYQNTRQRPDETFVVSRDYRTDGFGRQMFIEEVINNSSEIIRYRNNPYSNERLSILTQAAEYLDGAVDGNLPTDSAVINGWNLYRDPELVDVNLLINANYTRPAVQLAMSDIAESRQDCLAILDIPRDKQKVATAVNYRRNDLNLDSSYSAMYTPHVKILDTDNDREVVVAPSGLVAAAMARTDREAALWFATAGMSRGDLNVLGVDEIYNQGARDALDDAQLNSIRVIPGSGYKIWGNETLQTMSSALSNVNVRRLLNYIKKSIALASTYSVFMPHTESLRLKLKDMCERFLSPLVAGQGLYWFAVQCDEDNNPPPVIAAGDVVLDVFLDPVIPAKRIHLNAVVTKTGANFQEAATAIRGL